MPVPQALIPGEPTWLYRQILRWLGPVVRTYSRVELRGLEHLPTNRGVVLAANHPGSLWWDALCMAAALGPRPVRFLGNGWDFRHRLFGGFLRKAGVLAQAERLDEIDQRDPVVQCLRANEWVCCFPEQAYHTFWRRYTLFRFAPHALRYAEQGGALVVPTAIVGVEEAAATLFGPKWAGMPFHWPLLPPVLLPSKILVEFGQPLDVCQFVTADTTDTTAWEQAGQQLQAAVAALLGKFRKTAISSYSYLEHSGWW